MLLILAVVLTCNSLEPRSLKRQDPTSKVPERLLLLESPLNLAGSCNADHFALDSGAIDERPNEVGDEHG